MLNLDLINVTVKTSLIKGKPFIFDPIRKKNFSLTPEELVRQKLLTYLITILNYPQSFIAVEKQINFGTLAKRFDIVIYNRDFKPWMLVECKAPDVELSEKTLYQLLNYNHSLQCKYWLITNGQNSYCADATNTTSISWLQGLPGFPNNS